MSMEEFALCWNNFTDNIVTSFSSLLQQSNFCDVTLAVEGKLLKAHKVVLSICSPYFQRIFIENPCQHPIIILKDMSSKLVSNLLEFMYQGSVNVKQSELKAFMKIAESLQIKGLTTNSKKMKGEEGENCEAEKDQTAENKSGTKRSLDCDENSSASNLKVKSQKMDGDEDVTDLTNDDECEAQSNEELLMAVPEISMVESRSSDTTNKTKETADGLRITSSHHQTLNLFSPYEYSAEALLAEAQNKSAGPSDISLNSTSGSSITMLSSTSLLHGNCVFNRNNTVATQQGLKTYWLCKSYRISMCKARCITHQGKVISATGVHNHLPHMNNSKDPLPPGHTQNVLCSPPINEFNASAMPSSSSSNQSSQNTSVSAQQHLMMSQPYHYALHHHGMHENHPDQIQRSLQLPNIQNLGNSHDSKLTFNSSESNNFKLEHI